MLDHPSRCDQHDIRRHRRYRHCATARPRRHPITPSTSDGRPAGPRAPHRRLAPVALRAGRSQQVDLGKSISASRSRQVDLAGSSISCGAELKRARPAGPCGAIGRAPGGRSDLVAHPRARERSGAIAGGGEFLFREYHGGAAQLRGRVRSTPGARPIAPHGAEWGGRTAIAEFRLAGMRLHPLTSLVAHPRARERSGAIAGGGEFLFREYHGGARSYGVESDRPPRSTDRAAGPR